MGSTSTFFFYVRRTGPPTRASLMHMHSSTAHSPLCSNAYAASSRGTHPFSRSTPAQSRSGHRLKAACPPAHKYSLVEYYANYQSTIASPLFCSRLISELNNTRNSLSACAHALVTRPASSRSGPWLPLNSVWQHTPSADSHSSLAPSINQL